MEAKEEEEVESQDAILCNQVEREGPPGEDRDTTLTQPRVESARRKRTSPTRLVNMVARADQDATHPR